MWVEADPEKVAARHKAYREGNREKLAAYQRSYRKANKEKVAARWKSYRERHKEEVAERMSAYHKATRGNGKRRAKNSAKTAARRARKRNTEVKNCPRVKAIYFIAAWLRSEGDDVHVDHIIPLSRGGTHTHDNLQILTAEENLRKGTTCSGLRCQKIGG